MSSAGQKGASSRGLWVLLFIFILSFGGWAGDMEKQETSFEWCSVSHPSRLGLISAPRRGGILRILAGQLVAHPADTWRVSFWALSLHSVLRCPLPCALLWVERGFQTCREQGLGAHARSHSGARGGALEHAKGEFQEWRRTYLFKSFKKHSPSLSMKKNRFNVCWSDKWAGTRGREM